MNEVFRDIFRAIHEGKWISIEYHNKQEQNTKYWIGDSDFSLVRYLDHDRRSAAA